MSDIVDIEDGGLAAFFAAHDGQSHLLVFTAPWCGPCRAMAPVIEDIAAAYAPAVSVGRICIEASPGIAETYGVRSVPTLIVERDGVQIHRSFGALSKTRLAMMLDEALANDGQCA